MMVEILVRIVIEQLCFLELSGSDIVNEDAAVQQLENVVAELERLADEERERQMALIREEAAKAKTAGEPASRIAFIESLPDALGLER